MSKFTEFWKAKKKPFNLYESGKLVGGFDTKQEAEDAKLYYLRMDMKSNLPVTNYKIVESK